eukprot:3936157-Prymnesium_polylepis.1
MHRSSPACRALRLPATVVAVVASPFLALCLSPHCDAQARARRCRSAFRAVTTLPAVAYVQYGTCTGPYTEYSM